MPQTAGKTVRLSDEDKAALELIKITYGLPSDSSALRYVIRKVARQIRRKQEGSSK